MLICTNSNPEVFSDLQPAFARLDMKRMTEADECVRAQSAAATIGRLCLAQQQDCSTPRFIDGKSIANYESSYDFVLLFWVLQHGSLSFEIRTTKRMVGSFSGWSGSTRSRNPVRSGFTVAKTEAVSSPETGYSGEVFLFEPRPGQLRRGKQFKDLSPEELRKLLTTLLER